MRTLGLVASLLLMVALGLFVLYPRIDLFSAGYLALSTFLAILQAIVYSRFAHVEDIRQIFYARHLDTLWDRCVPFLGLAEFAVYFEYAKTPLWHVLAPLQSTGLLLLAGAVIWLCWVDYYLLRHFETSYRDGVLLTGGPFRYIRHPRYAGLLATRLALPLVFVSGVGCILTVVWTWLIRRRVRLEEDHLRARFGDVYTRYAARTRGLLV